MDRYGIELRDKRSWITKGNSMFSPEDMELAKKYSFFVNVIYLNYRLRDCLRLWAEQQKKKYIEMIIDFMEILPFDLTGRPEYPYITPSVKEAFKHRNRVFRTVISKYCDIVAYFKVFSGHKYDSMLVDYEDCYSEQYYKLKRWSGLEAS